MNLSAVEMKAFVPAANFDTSKKFYLARPRVAVGALCR